MWLVQRGVTPNAISVASVAFALLAGVCLAASRFAMPWWARSLLFLGAIAGIQLRLLCNLFDGMVAVEGGKAGKAGEIYNDFPDRLADPIILAAAGYAAARLPGAIDIGWAAAAMSLLTAYTRVLGRSVGAGIYFTGPMAKQHRMALMTLACALAAVLTPWGLSAGVLWGALILIALGCIVTVVRRLWRIVIDLERK
jgi:phosphatidylglycerophosphate synthase